MTRYATAAATAPLLLSLALAATAARAQEVAPGDRLPGSADSLTSFAAPGDSAAPAPTVSSQSPAAFAGTPDWTGFYAGGQIGFGNVDTSGFGSDEDIIGGLVLGYDFDLQNNWVVGLGLDYDFADIDVTPGASLEEIFRVKARGGYKFGRGLLYGTGGYAYADSDRIGDDDGWFIGGGYEYMVSESFSLGGEVLYHEFDSFGSTGRDLEVTTVQIRATFRF